MNIIKEKLKSNKGFTMQDLIFALMIIMIFVGVIGSIFVSIYSVKADTLVDSMATIYAIKMLEYMDKINYEKVSEENKSKLISEMQRKFDIPSSYKISLDVTKYRTSLGNDDYVRIIKLKMDYTFKDKARQLVFDTIKVKEL